MAGPRDIDETDDEEVLDPNEVEGDDAGSIDDESGDDAQTGQELETDQTQERVDRRSRRDDQIREELRAAREHTARVEAELRQLQQAREQPRQPVEESEEAFQARLALLDPDTRQDVKLDRALKRQAQQLALQSFAMLDRADKAAYDAKAANDPIYRKYAQDVEATLAEARKRGWDINRESALYFVRGRASSMNQGKPSPAKQQAQRRVQSQQARTTGGRGDESREQRQRRYAPNDNSPEAVRSRLEAPDAYI